MFFCLIYIKMKKIFVLVLCIVHCALCIDVMATLPFRDKRLKKMKVYERVDAGLP